MMDGLKRYRLVIAKRGNGLLIMCVLGVGDEIYKSRRVNFGGLARI